MLIQSHKVSSLRGRCWAGVELTSEARTEEVVLHLARWMIRNFNEPWQVFFPVRDRTVEAVTMVGPYLWVRVRELEKLRGVKQIMGVVGVVRDGKDRVIGTDDTFVQSLIADCRARAGEWSKGVKKGSFVRVLLGRQRALCGEVKGIKDGIADLLIRMRLRDVRLRIPVGALGNLGPREGREYYYKES